MTKKRQSKEAAKPRRRRQHASDADWTAVESGLLGTLIGAVTATGGAIRFGYTKDGGAYSLGIYGDGTPYTEFCPGSTDVEAWIEGFILDFE